MVKVKKGRHLIKKNPKKSGVKKAGKRASGAKKNLKPQNKGKLSAKGITVKNSINKIKLPSKKIDEKRIKKEKQIDLGLQQINDLLSQAYARQLLINIGGENALAIVRNFSENLNDEELAKRLRIRISDVRATLNRLHNEGLVNYSRERDNESGWYSYTWSLNKERVREWINERSKNSIFNAETWGDHYFCPSCGVESLSPFEKAVECEFKCQKCERTLEFVDNEKAGELFELGKERGFSKK